MFYALNDTYNETPATPDDDFGDTISDATLIPTDGTEVFGSYDYLGDRDVLAITVTEGDNVSVQGLMSVSPRYRILDGDGNVILDQVGLANFIAPHSGTVYIELSQNRIDDDQSPTGDYGITVEILDNPYVVTGRDVPDLLVGTVGNDKIFGLAGSDFIFANNGDDTIYGGDDNDVVRAGFGDDTIFGENGDDALFGSFGNDIIDGGEGADNLNGERGADVIDGGAGNDIIRGGGGDDYANGGSGNDVIFGNNGNDLLIGNVGNDRLSGGNGEDALYGGAGRDWLFGQDGNDFLHGGAGRDVFVFGNGDGYDRIADFQDGFDKIDLRSLDSVDGFDDLSLVINENGVVLIQINELQSIELTGITDIHDITAEDFWF